MSTLAEVIAQTRDTRDFAPLLAALPYTRWLGFSAEMEGESVRLALPFRDAWVGNPVLPALHGGLVGACLETAALLQIVLLRESLQVPKTIDFTVDFLRAARAETLYAMAEIMRHGRRIVNVRMRAFQSDPAAPVALGRAHFLLE